MEQDLHNEDKPPAHGRHDNDWPDMDMDLINDERACYSLSQSRSHDSDNAKTKSSLSRTLNSAQEDSKKIRSLVRIAHIGREYGNAAYDKGHFEKASLLYTRAIGYNFTEPVFSLNRAACQLKLDRLSAAERDCSAVIAFDDTKGKVLYRRGVSRARKGKLADAKTDFEAALFLCKAEPAVYVENLRLSREHMKEPAALFGQTCDCVAELAPRPFKSHPFVEVVKQHSKTPPVVHSRDDNSKAFGLNFMSRTHTTDPAAKVSLTSERNSPTREPDHPEPCKGA